LDEDAANHDGNQFAALENHLRRVIQISQGRVRATHCRDREKGKKCIRQKWNFAFGFKNQLLLDETENGVPKELQQGKMPSIRLEVTKAEDPFLEIAIKNKKEEDRETASDELACSTKPR